MSQWQNRITGYELVPVNQLQAHPYNARRHPAKQREALRGSLDTLGIIAPVIVNTRTGYCIDGHARIEEALTQDDSQELPVIYVDLDEAEEAQALASYDFITYLAEYDRDNLDTLLRDVQTDDERVQSLLSELAEDNDLYFGDEPVIPDAPEAQIDRAEELNQKWQVQSGDLYVIPSLTGEGEHRLLCGDSTNADDVARLMGGEKVDAVVTDPPYNVAQDTELYAQNQSRALKDLANSDWDYNFNPIDFLKNTYGFMSKDCWIYIFTAHHLFGGIFEWLNSNYAKTGFCVWCKPNPMPSLAKNTWTFGVELCLFAKNGKPTFNYPHGEHALNWWAFNKSSDGTHPTQKTLNVIAHIVKHVTSPNAIVGDWFGGSGTTMVACEQLSRQCRMIEIEPKYCAVILERMAQMGCEPRKIEQ